MRVLRFIVENHRSFREVEELSFLATARTDETGDVIDGSIHAAHGLLPVVGVYGANASGKSNLLEALLIIPVHLRSEGPPPGLPSDPLRDLPSSVFEPKDGGSHGRFRGARDSREGASR